MAGDTGNQDSGGGIMQRLEQALMKMDPDRLEDFFSWLESGDWTDREIQSVRIMGPRRITSMGLSIPLIEHLKPIMKEQGIKSLSGLCEMLLWNFAGQPAELVEKHKPMRKPRPDNQ